MSEFENMETVTFKITVLAKGKRAPDVLETRKFSVARSNLSLESICAAYGSDEVVFCYRDKENDLISLRTQADLDEFFRSNPAPQDDIYRLTTFKGRDSITTRVAKTSKQIAEEAIVLGVRGATWAESKWNGSGPVQIAAPVTAPVEPPALETSTTAVESPVGSPSANSNIKSIAVKIAESGKQLAEEALVLGVRGVSYVEHQWNTSAPAPVAAAAAAAPESVPVSPAPPAMSESWVNVEAASTVVSAPPAEEIPAANPVSPVEHLLKELVRKQKIGAVFSDLFLKRPSWDSTTESRISRP